jgi:hypothetical protein
MPIPIFVGGLTGLSFVLIHLTVAKTSTPNRNTIPSAIVQSAFVGTITGLLFGLFSEPVVVAGTLQDKQTEQHFFLSSTVALVKTNGGMLQTTLPGVQGLGIKEGDAVKVSGVQYLTPSLRDFSAISKEN